MSIHIKSKPAVIMKLFLFFTIFLVTHHATAPTSALSYEDGTSVQFTFNSALSISVSGDLHIDELSPGYSSDSNIIDINVTTNNATGYNLYATTGNTSYNTTNLTHDAISTSVFTSLSTTDTIADLSSLEPNTWGYSYSNDSSTWSNYSGLPLYTAEGAVLMSSTAAADDDVSFKIAAKADTSQTSGTYTNVINFTAITNKAPVSFYDAYKSENKEMHLGYFTMQDMTSSICETVDVIGEDSTTNLIDIRDNQTYTVSKLKDGKCWMTENLNLAGGTALSADDTDVTSDYISSFTTSNNLTKDDTNDTIILPASSTSGFNTNNYSYVYNSGNKTSDCSSPGCYSYYSWDAATLGSGRSISADNTDAEQSICPKGWRLPTAYTTSATNWQTTSDFYVLAHQYGLDSTTSTAESDNDFYAQAGPGTVPNFLLAGYYYYGIFNDGGSYGDYWSATSGSDTNGARSLKFYSGSVSSAIYYYRYGGFSIRCLAR